MPRGGGAEEVGGRDGTRKPLCMMGTEESTVAVEVAERVGEGMGEGARGMQAPVLRAARPAWSDMCRSGSAGREWSERNVERKSDRSESHRAGE